MKSAPTTPFNGLLVANHENKKLIFDKYQVIFMKFVFIIVIKIYFFILLFNKRHSVFVETLTVGTISQNIKNFDKRWLKCVFTTWCSSRSSAYKTLNECCEDNPYFKRYDSRINFKYSRVQNKTAYIRYRCLGIFDKLSPVTSGATKRGRLMFHGL